MKRSILFLAAVIAALAAPASALTASEVRQCQAMAATFAPKKADFDTLTATRDTLADEAEMAGDIWENAEALRHFSIEAAAEADAARVIYDEAVEAFDNAEYALRAQGAQLNQDFAAYNAKCVKD